MSYRRNPTPVEEISTIDPRIAQRQAQLEAQRAAAAAAAAKKNNTNSSWNPSGRTGGTTSTGDVRVWGKEESVYTPPANNYSGGNVNSGSYSGNSGGGGGAYAAAQTAIPTYAELPEYQSRYADAIEALSKKILNRGAFSYNHLNDPTYQNYEKQYRRMGEMAMEDTMGKLAGKTGGLASSYAASAAQQANNAYMSELSGIIPELEQLAYSMYLNEGNAMMDNLNSLINMDNMDYSRYRDEVSDHFEMLNRQATRKAISNEKSSSIESSLNFLVDSGAIDADTAASIYLGNTAGNTYATEEKTKKKLGNGGR